jgi:hypothetical protein
VWILHLVIATGSINLSSSEKENGIFVATKRLRLDLFYFLLKLAEIREKVLSGIFLSHNVLKRGVSVSCLNATIRDFSHSKNVTTCNIHLLTWTLTNSSITHSDQALVYDNSHWCQHLEQNSHAVAANEIASNGKLNGVEKWIQNARMMKWMNAPTGASCKMSLTKDRPGDMI